MSTLRPCCECMGEFFDGELDIEGLCEDCSREQAREDEEAIWGVDGLREWDYDDGYEDGQDPEDEDE